MAGLNSVLSFFFFFSSSSSNDKSSFKRHKADLSFDILKLSLFSNKLDIWGGMLLSLIDQQATMLKKKSYTVVGHYKVLPCVPAYLITWKQVSQDRHYSNFVAEEIHVRAVWTCWCQQVSNAIFSFYNITFCHSWE